MSARMDVPFAVEQQLELNLQLTRLTDQQDLLREEIKQGERHLASAERELDERNARLEEWPSYERICGADCLIQLTEQVQAHRRVKVFLRGWLKRRRAQLEALDEAIAELPKPTRRTRQSPEVSLPRRLKRSGRSRLLPTALTSRRGLRAPTLALP